MDYGPVIDFHLHLPYRYKDPIAAADYLVRKLDEAHVERAVVIAIEGGVESFKKRINPEYVRSAVQEILDYVAHSPIRSIRTLIFEPDKGIDEHVQLLIEHRRRTEEVVEAAERYPGRLYPVGSYNPDYGVDRVIERMRAFRDKLLGVKIYPTLHCISPSSSKLYKLYKFVESINGIVIVHTGCDPGLWELPRMCRHARPKFVAEAAKKFPNVPFIIAHMGSYSAIMPGIYFREALQAYSVENVWMDTSAVDPLFVERAVEEVGYDKILFGSDFPYLVGFTIEDSIKDILKLDISNDAKRAILYDNALRLLRMLGRL
ncbi:MAG: amidohydrolase family protein [Desulfurococcales archaeon]|nr:amidohydrolase family protein [Desulfurococcales archaeon]